jgi:voltage-gated potassium channel
MVIAVVRDKQLELFVSVPAAMWWGITTLTTVCYGDTVPVTALGGSSVASS